MGGFYLTRKINNIERAISGFSKLGLNNYEIISCCQFKLILYTKSEVPVINHITDGSFFVGTNGTPVYKGYSYSEGLRVLFNDLKVGDFDRKNLSGHYIIFISTKDRLEILTDGTSLLKIFCDKEGNSMCSSFIVLSEADFSSLTLNRSAIAENIITGGIIGDSTLFNEINVFSRRQHTKIFSTISFEFPQEPEIKTINNRDQALSDQISALRDYFMDLQKYADEFGADTGLTGGYDSRMLLGLQQMSDFKNLQVHCHFRGKSDKEWIIARDIANTANVEFVSPEIKDTSILTKDDRLGILDQSFYFHDGQIRSNCFWNEVYNTKSYRMKVLGNKRLGFYGIGGEQYRNTDRISGRKIPLYKWIKYKFIRKISGKAVINSSEEAKIVKEIEREIKFQLDIPPGQKRISLFDLKRIQNEVMIGSYRGARVHSENKLCFFLSPFCDTAISRKAYEIIPFLDLSSTFQQDMIMRISPGLASSSSVYGHSFNKREPFGRYLLSVFTENVLPFGLSWFITDSYRRLKHRKSMNSRNQMNNNYKELIENVIQLDLPVRIDRLLKRHETAPIIISLGFFISKYKHKLITNERFQ